MVTDTDVTPAERRQALEAVVNSQVFARSAQLRSLLRYICEREIEGHPEQLTEYQIAVNVLGRSKDYNLSDDSAVRNRAYELRQRLEKFYQQEQPSAKVRIEIPRGSYVPQFLRRHAPPLPPAASNPRESAFVQTERKLSRRPLPIWIVAALAISTGVLGLAIGLGLNRPQVAGIVRDAWGPLAEAGRDLTICVATNLHMIVRPHIEPQRLRFAAPAEIRDVYGSVRPLEPGVPLFMEPAQLSVPLAEMIGVTQLCNVRVKFGGAYQILPESEAPVSALRGRDAFLIGSGTNSQAATILLRNLPFTIDYTSNDQFAVFDRRKQSGKQAVFVCQPFREPVAAIQYGLISVISGTSSSGKPTRTVVLSGVGSASIQAAVEFFCSPLRLGDMKRLFEAEGGKGFPAIYQIVVRSHTASSRLMSYEYVTHAVVQKN